MAEFEAWPKIPRWNREVVITEKIDGSNAAIIIEPWSDLAIQASDGWNWTEDYFRKYGRNGNALLAVVGEPREREFEGSTWVDYGPDAFGVFAQSRTRLITPEQDNFGFATYVKENAEGLVKLLGPGRHFGEWYGKGIQRGYGLDHKRFALFDAHRWMTSETQVWDRVAAGQEYALSADLRVDIVPILARPGSPSLEVNDVLYDLEAEGSYLVPGFMKPEGVVIYHTAGRQTYKILLEGDDKPKGLAA